MRVGFWRLKKMMDSLSVRPTVTLNARVCEDYPEVAGACLEAGWEFNAHSYEQVPMHKLDDERAVIDRSMDIIEKFTGSRPRGWFGPGLTQTFETLDHLSAAGIEYIGDWVLDDQPIWARTKHDPVAALPYNYELHDIVMMNIQNNLSHIYRDRALDYFNTLYEESLDGHPRVVALAMHSYLSGSPHRIAYVRETFETLLSHPGVVCWDGVQILDWFSKQVPAPKN
jgi:peptidoglycan/xylan/chitin deacetylase (PgdA/CDA1 family)